MKASVELSEGKYNDSFEEETKGLESITKLISESIQNDNIFSFNGSLSNLEIPKNNFSRFQSLEIKDKILINVINEIKQDLNEEEKKIVLFEQDLEKKEKNEIDDKNKNTNINIYNSINKFVHKILHGKKNKNIEENFEFLLKRMVKIRKFLKILKTLKPIKKFVI